MKVKRLLLQESMTSKKGLQLDRKGLGNKGYKEEK
jgi:hypothetical protein